MCISDFYLELVKVYKRRGLYMITDKSKAISLLGERDRSVRMSGNWSMFRILSTWNLCKMKKNVVGEW